ncbi:MAG: hypothetical protein FJY65_12680, partial [Calditrichaeota bacterium]|nr:hypothetical protein [Calditrichota bacterium]
MFSRPILLSGYFHTSSLLVVTLLLGSTSLEISSTRTDRIFTLDDTNLPVVQSQTIDEQFGKIISSSSSSSSSSLSRDAGEGRLLWSLNDNNAITENIALSADGRWVAVGFTLNDERLEVRDAASGQLQFAYSVETGGSNVAISSDGSLIAFSAMDSLWLFRRQNGAQPVMRVGFNGFTTMQVAISGDGRWIYAAGLDPQRRRNRLWAFRDGNPQAVWTAEVDAAEAYGWSGVTLTRDGQLLAANGKFHLYIYNAQNGDLIWDEPTYNTESPTALSSDGRILATASL